MRDMELLTTVPERVQFTAWDKEGSQKKRSLLVKNAGNDPFVVRVSNTQTSSFKLVPPKDADNDAGPPPHFLLTVPPNSTKKFSLEIVEEVRAEGDGGGKPHNLRDEVVVYTGAGMIRVPILATCSASAGKSSPPSPSSYQPSEQVVEGRCSLFTHAMLEDFSAGPIVSHHAAGLGPTESGRRSQLSSGASSLVPPTAPTPAPPRTLDDLSDGEAAQLEAALEQQRTRALAAAMSELGVSSLPTREEALGETIRSGTMGRTGGGPLGEGGAGGRPETPVVATAPTGVDVFFIDGAYYNARGEEVNADGSPLGGSGEAGGALYATSSSALLEPPRPGMKRTLKVESRGVGNHMPKPANSGRGGAGGGGAGGDGMLPHDTAPAALGGAGGNRAMGLGAAMEEQRAKALEAAMRELGLKDLPRREDVLGETAPPDGMMPGGDELGSSVWGGSSYGGDDDGGGGGADSFRAGLMPPGMMLASSTMPGGTQTAYAAAKRGLLGGGGAGAPPLAPEEGAPRKSQAEMDDAWDALGGI